MEPSTKDTVTKWRRITRCGYINRDHTSERVIFLIPLQPGKMEVVWTCTRGSRCKGLTVGDASAGAGM